MGSSHSAEETRDAYVAAMGRDLGEVFHALYEDVAFLHIHWHQFVILFGTKPERIPLLNKAGGLFFRIVQDTFWERTLLHLARVTDPPAIGDHRNLSIQSLPKLVGDRDMRPDLETLTSQAYQSTLFARDWRNRRIAHSDLALALKCSAEPLAKASRLQVTEALASVVAVLNCLQRYYMKGTLVFPMLSDPGNAEWLLHVLRDGVEAEEARRAKTRNGTSAQDNRGSSRDI